MRLATSVALSLTLAAFAPAQTAVTLRATPTDGSAAGCYYCPGYEHVIKLVGTRLVSTSVNILAYHDQDVVMTGTWNGTVVDVTSIQPTVESFSLSGQGRIGRRLDFSTVGPIGALAVNCAALGSGFAVPAADLALQLQPASLVVMGAGTIGGGGEFKVRLDIPDEPALVGLRLFGQALVVPAQGGAYTTNVDSRDIAN